MSKRKERLKENGRQMKKQSRSTRELKNGRLLQIEFRKLSTFIAFNFFFNVLELFSLYSRQPWLFITVCCLADYYGKNQVNYFRKKTATSAR